MSLLDFRHWIESQVPLWWLGVPVALLIGVLIWDFLRKTRGR